MVSPICGLFYSKLFGNISRRILQFRLDFYNKVVKNMWFIFKVSLLDIHSHLILHNLFLRFQFWNTFHGRTSSNIKFKSEQFLWFSTLFTGFKKCCCISKCHCVLMMLRLLSPHKIYLRFWSRMSQGKGK